MNKPYTPKSVELFDSKAAAPFRVSRSGIESYLACPCCFCFTYRLGLRRPSIPPLKLNLLADKLLKKEFNFYRRQRSTPPLFSQLGLEGIPFDHPLLDVWRTPWRGLSILHKSTNLRITGAVDDVWIIQGALCIVDFKVSDYPQEPSLENDGYGPAYKRQLEVYRFLLKQQPVIGAPVSQTAYILYWNALDRDRFDNVLHFTPTLVSHVCDDSWIEPVLLEIKKCLLTNMAPEPNPECEVCSYVQARHRL